MRRTLASALLILATMCGAAAAQDWLALCSKCLSPSVQSKSGIGTANAVATARITEADARDWCANWQPGDGTCVREQMSTPEAKQTFRATADCPAGRITPIDGKTYRRDGIWPGGDIGAGRPRFRDAAGRVVGRDNASGGLGIAQQWELLCPVSATTRPAPPPPRATAAPQATPQAAYQVGQHVEARHGSQWIRGRITRLVPTTTRGQREMHYEVALENRQRGIVPAHWVRPLATP